MFDKINVCETAGEDKPRLQPILTQPIIRVRSARNIKFLVQKLIFLERGEAILYVGIKSQDKEPKPPFPDQPQQPPGYEAQMTPTADHGEESYKGSGKLTGKAAIITGGDSGIGRAIAIAFAREGADVLISYLNEDADADETHRLVEKEGRKCVTVAGDIGEEALCKRIVETATKEFGKLDILINNAAFQRTHEKIEEFSSEEFDKTYKTNVYAMFYLCKAALP
jgi:uncharacterized protein YrzB (UPF0473 family)